MSPSDEMTLVRIFWNKPKKLQPEEETAGTLVSLSSVKPKVLTRRKVPAPEVTHGNFPNTYCRKVLWSDKPKQTFLPQEVFFVGVKVRLSYNTMPTIKHSGGSVMLWDWCIAPKQNNETFQAWHQTTSQVVETWTQLGDGDAKHIKTGSDWMKTADIKLPNWPSQNLNPTEHFWTVLKQWIRARKRSKLRQNKNS